MLKEAAYKAWSTLGGELLDFHDVQLAVDGDRYAADIVDRSVRLSGRFVAVAGRWLALVVR